MRTLAQRRSQLPGQESAGHPLAPAAAPEAHHRAEPILRLQRTIGNQATRQLLLQAKLTVNAPGDVYEQEADHVADRVMRMPEPQVQRVCDCGGSCPKCQKEQADRDHRRVQTQSAQGSAGEQAERAEQTAPPIVDDVLRSSGQPLDTAARSFLEPRFGADFSQVRVHTDDTAAKSARAIQADAYTSGQNVVFGAGQYRPETDAGKRLLAHELTHTLQQGSGAPLQRQKKPAAKPAVPPAVAGGNVLYIGMNNYKPEVAKLNKIYKGTSVKVTTVTVTEEESKTTADGGTYDLTGEPGILAFAKSLPLKTAALADEVKKLLLSQSNENRDDLAHVISVYAATEADGTDRMSRVVLSGHSYGTKVYNEDVKGAIYFDALVKLATLFPTSAGQTKHLLVLACLAGEEDTVKKVYTQAFPNLQTFWGWTNTCPTGWGAAKALEEWSGITDVNPTKLDMPPSGQANWAMGVYQSDAPVDGPALISGLRADESKFNEYFAGTKVDKDNHSGFLFEYYRRARTAEQHSSTIIGADHDYAKLHADQSFRLRFWPAMVSNFWKKNQAAIKTGYGSAAAPAYGTMSRKAALAAIASFDTTTTATGKDKDEAARLLKALKDLDPVELNDNWLTP